MKKTAVVLFASGFFCLGCRPKTSRDNVLLITIDTLRADHLGAYGYQEAQTPNLDTLARNGFLFRDVTTPVPLTLPAHASLLTSLYPPNHGVRDNGTFKLSEEQTSLAEIFKESGYSTGAIVASYVLNSRFGLAQGFQDYDDRMVAGGNADLCQGREIDAARVTGKAVVWLKKRKEPFFLWVHYFDPHADYLPPEPFRSDFSANPYDGEIAYVDRQLGKLLDFLKEEGMLDRTVVVITSDHGEGLGEHGEPTHGLLVYQSTLQIPLIFSGGKIPVGMSYQPVSLLDIFPTVLGWLGIPIPEWVQGRDLRPIFSGGAVPQTSLYFETLAPLYNLNWSGLKGLRERKRKFIQAPYPEVYDLKGDPGEERNLLGADPSLEADLSFRLKVWEEKFAAERARIAEKPNLSSSEKETLLSLGYGGGEFKDDRAPRKDPKNMVEVMALISRSESQLRQQNLTGVETTLQELLLKDACNPVARERLVNVYLARSELDEAVTAVQEAIACNPKKPQLLKLKAEILRRQGELWKAEKVIRNALEFDSFRPDLWVERGKIARELGRFSEACQSFQKALAHDATFIPAYCNLADYYFRVREWEEARKALVRAIELDAANPDLYCNLGIFFMERGEKDKAKAEFKKALLLEPSHSLSRQKMFILEGVGNFKAGKEPVVIE